MEIGRCLDQLSIGPRMFMLFRFRSCGNGYRGLPSSIGIGGPSGESAAVCGRRRSTHARYLPERPTCGRLSGVLINPFQLRAITSMWTVEPLSDRLESGFEIPGRGLDRCCRVTLLSDVEWNRTRRYRERGRGSGCSEFQDIDSESVRRLYRRKISSDMIRLFIPTLPGVSRIARII